MSSHIKSGRRHRCSVSAIGSGAIWSGINTIVMRGANLALTVIVVRIVSPHDFGVFTAALVVATIAGSISELGVASALIRRDLDVDELAPAVVGVAWLWSAALAGGMVLMADQLAGALGAPDASGPIRIMAIGVVASGFSSVPGALLARDFRQGTLFLGASTAFLPSSALLILLALGGSGATAFAWSKAVTPIITGVVFAIAARRWDWPSLRGPALGRVLRLGVPLAGANALGYTLLNADFALVGHAAGPAVLGIYSVAFSISSLSVSALSSALNSVAMPAFSSHAGAPAGLRASVHSWARGLFLVGLPTCALTVALSRQIVGVLYGPPWAAAAPVIAVLALYGVPLLFELMLANFLVAIGRTGTVCVLQAIWLVGLTGAMLLGLSLGGLQGVAWAHVAVLLVIVLPFQTLVVSKAVPGILAGVSRALVRPGAAALLSALVAGAVAAPFREDLAGLAAGGVLGVAIYALSTWQQWTAYIPILFGSSNSAARSAIAAASESHSLEEGGR